MGKECKHYGYITKILTGGRSPIPVVEAYIYKPEILVKDAVKESEVPEKQPFSSGKGRGCLVIALLILALILFGVRILLAITK